MIVLRNLLRCVADDQGNVRKDQLEMAAKLAGMTLPQSVSQQVCRLHRIKASMFR